MSRRIKITKDDAKENENTARLFTPSVVTTDRTKFPIFSFCQLLQLTVINVKIIS